MRVASVAAMGCLLALAGCGGGTASASLGSILIPIPFSSGASPQTFSAANGDGPATTTAQFTAGAGIVALDNQPADTNTNTVTITLTGVNGLANISVVAGTAAGAGVAGATTAASGPFVEDSFSLTSSNDLSAVLADVANGEASPVVLYQGTAVGLTSSAYGLWAVNTGGTNYNVGTFAFGKETSAADMATLAVNGAPVNGMNQTTLTYNGNTIGFGSYTTAGGAVGAPFTFNGTAQIVADFATSQVTTISFSNLTTSDVNDANPGPTLTTLATAAPVAIISTNKYTGVLAGTASNGGAPVAIGGPVNGTFYGPLALETAGTYSATGGAVKLIGAFGAGPSHQ
jgi:hypothetical protein